jgi:hypothetical protein
MKSPKDTKIIENFDSWIHSKLTFAALKWIRKNKYQKHKFDLLLSLKYKFIYGMGLIVSFWLGKSLAAHQWLLAGIISTGFLMVILESIDIPILRDISDDYTFLFMNRSNPAVYQAIKDLCERSFEQNRAYRELVLTLTSVFLFTFLLLFVVTKSGFIGLSIFLPANLFNLYRTYNSSIFDFDKPPDKPKEVKTKLTEVAMAAWQRLIGTEPSPA